MLTADYSNQFKRDYKRSMKRNLDITLLDKVIRDLIHEIPLDRKYKDHPLTGNYAGCRECHIKPDWLLIYQIGNGVIVFERTGTHADLLE
jgi:mRNA interferase YafQ